MITEKPIRPEEHTNDVDPECGAVVTFTGVVRSPNNGRPVASIFYDCYREMAEREIASVVDDIKTDWPVDTVKVVHRVGEVGVGDISLLVVVTAIHRREAFEAGRKTVDEIKRRVPIWKKERYDDTTTKWL